MQPRVWDRFLTEQDRAHLAASTHRPIGFGQRPALLLIDNYRWVLGDQPEPLVEAIKNWPGSTGLAGWEAITRVRELLAAAREVGIPVVHVTGLHEDESGLPGWSFRRERAKSELNPEAQDRVRRKYDIVDEAAPIAGEVVLRKSAPSAFWGTPLAGHLVNLGIDTLIVGGESTSGCVRASVVEGASYRYRMIVAEECVYDRHEAAHAINLFDMDQKYADVLPLAQVVEWLRAWRAQGNGETSSRSLAAAAAH